MYIIYKQKIVEFLGWSATGLAMPFFISPIIPFINLFKGKITYEETPMNIIGTSFVNCFCWCIYGDIIFSHQIKICNLIGTISNSILITIYLAYELRKYTIDAILNALIVMTGSYAIYKGFTTIIEDNSLIGKICIGTSCMVFLSPIQIIYRVMKEKNYHLIPIYIAFASLASTICWVIYGVFLTDINIILPNFIGIILATTQIVIFLRYKRNYPGIGEKENTATIDIEGNENEKEEKENEKDKKKEKEKVKDKKDEETTRIKIDEDAPIDVKEKPVKIVTKTDN